MPQNYWVVELELNPHFQIPKQVPDTHGLFGVLFVCEGCGRNMWVSPYWSGITHYKEITRMKFPNRAGGYRATEAAPKAGLSR